MRFFLLILVVALPGLAGAATREPTALVLNRPSVVVVYTPDAEVTEASRKEPGFADFIDDFEYYTQTVAAALHNTKGIAFYRSTSATISFKGGEHLPVTRQSLAGYGFIVYVPGKSPVIFRGVATDDDVLCAIQGLDP